MNSIRARPAEVLFLYNKAMIGKGQNGRVLNKARTSGIQGRT